MNAYEKDPLTGIVKHLDDQCFGCQYCILACPYEVPKYHAAKGIVRKCDMCSSRLEVGEAPACVQACPTQAIAIRIVSVENVIEDAEAALFLPTAPDPQITYPTTTYKSSRVLPRNMLPADYFQVSRQHPHWPLVVMLVLTQMSVGAFALGIVLERFVSEDYSAAVQPVQAAMALGFGLLALTASVLHLGRPQYAFRAVLGLRHSWLSREIVAFGLFAALACLNAAAVLAPAAWPLSRDVIGLLAWGVVVVGAAAVFCSIMIYASVRREFWNFPRTAVRFALTSVLLGLATLWLSLAVLAVIKPSETNLALVAASGPTICWALMIVACVKLGWEAMLFRHLLSCAMTPLKRSASLMSRDLASSTVARFALGCAGGHFCAGTIAPTIQRRIARRKPTRIDDRHPVALWRVFGRRAAGEIPVLRGGCGAAHARRDSLMSRLAPANQHSLPLLFDRAGTLHARVATRSRRGESGPRARKQASRCHRVNGLRLLLDGLQPRYPFARRRSGGLNADCRLSGKSGHGVPEGVGIAGGARCAGPGDAPLAARYARPIVARQSGIMLCARSPNE